MISIIACTKRLEYIPNLLRNVSEQTFQEKELILVLHGLPYDDYLKKMVSEQINKFKILSIRKQYSFGECMNIGIQEASNEFIAKSDDDDYYGPRHLECSLHALIGSNADITGKTTGFIYFMKEQILGLYLPYHENQLANHKLRKEERLMFGGSLLMKKKVWDHVKLQHVNRGIDTLFLEDSAQIGYQLFSNTRFHYVYYRYESKEHHTSKGNDYRLLKKCMLVKKTKDILPFINCSSV